MDKKLRSKQVLLRSQNNWRECITIKGGTVIRWYAEVELA